MVIYIEVVLIVNLLIHLLTILLIKEVLYLKFKKTMILSFLLDLVYMLLYIYEYDVSLFKYILPFIFIWLIYKTTFYMYFKSVILYYVLSYVLGGISTTLKISGNKGYFIIFIVFVIIVLIYYLFLKRKDIFIIYKIEYFFKGKKYSFDAFFDTGCNLMYKGLPVIILNKKYHFNIFSDEVLLFNSGGKEMIEKVYKLNNLKVLKYQLDCYCVFLDIDYDAIIGVNIISL